MKKLISIVGLTATGKTQLALFLAKKLLQKNLNKQSKPPFFPAIDLIAADSRQVYQGLEIVTGADIPKNFIKQKTKRKNQSPSQKNQAQLNFPYSYYQHRSLPIRLHLISIIKIDQAWSVAHFQQACQKIIKIAWENQTLPILVGGTGFYHQQLFNQDQQLKIKPNLLFRQQSIKMTLENLQNYLKKINLSRWQKMNHSDQHNPRRLIRSIEICLAKNKSQSKSSDFFQPLQIGIAQPKNLLTLKNIIQQRVNKRWRRGVVKEIRKIKPLALNPQSPALTTTGVKEINLYLQGKIKKQDCLELWSLHECQYAKRQLTWWKKRSGIQWFKKEKKYQDKIWQFISQQIKKE